MRYWGLIPAAGTGGRMGNPISKQFLNLGDRTIIERTVESLGSHEAIEGLVIGLARYESRYDWVESLHPKIVGVYEGGQSRAQTVLNGLKFMLRSGSSSDDWVLVHDANRPFVSIEDIDSLIQSVGDDINGGLLCRPVFDTVKTSTDGRVQQTLPRDSLFLAQTPQLFGIGILARALESQLQDGKEITDEAHAVESQGYCPVLVPGSVGNIKITTHEDLNLANAMLDLQSSNHRE